MDATSTEGRIFAGTSVHALDAKNRVTVPSRWRLGEKGEFFALPDPVKPAIGLLLPSELQQLLDDARSHPGMDGAKRRAFMRLYFSQAFPCPIDKQGRMVLPAEMCQRVGLKKEVVLVGTGTRIEVWSPSAWEAEQSASEEDFKSAAELLSL